MRVLLVVLTVVALCLPASAHAGWKTDRAKAIAAIVWHNPCGGGVAIRWANLDADADPEHFGDVAAETDVATCTVTFATGDHPTWDNFCTTMIHEYGHLAGFRDPLNPTDPMHSHDPNSVMAAVSLSVNLKSWEHGRWVQNDSGDQRCWGRGVRYLRSHPGQVATR